MEFLQHGDIERSFRDFIRYYRGPQLCINTVNVGISLLGLLIQPGASRIIHSFYIPYSKEAFDAYTGDLTTIRNHELVSKETASMLRTASGLKNGVGYVNIGMTGGARSSRYSSYHGQCFIDIDFKVYQIQLRSMPEIQTTATDQGLLEDNMYSAILMHLLTNGIEEMPYLGDGYCKRIV